MEATSMKPVGIVSTAVLFLIFGIAGPVYAQEQQENKPAQHDEAKPVQDKPSHQEEAKPGERQEEVKPGERREEARPEERREEAHPAVHEQGEQRGHQAGAKRSGHIPDE